MKTKYKTVTLTPVEILQNLLDGVEMHNDRGRKILFSESVSPSYMVDSNIQSLDMTTDKDVQIQTLWYDSVNFPCLIREHKTGGVFEAVSLYEDDYFLTGCEQSVKVIDCDLLSNEEIESFKQVDKLQDNSRDRNKWVIRYMSPHGIDMDEYVSSESPIPFDSNLDPTLFETQNDAELWIDNELSTHYARRCIAVRLRDTLLNNPKS